MTLRVAVIGCGSVSSHYLRDLARCDRVAVVAVADHDLGRAQARAAQFGVPQVYDGLDGLLAGVEFDLLVNLTAMQAHAGITRGTLLAGRHVWSEKPLATSPSEGRELFALAAERGLRLWAAPNAVTSPAFGCLAEHLANGAIGRVCAARARYGHGGPTWGPFFYQSGGGPLPDLAIYNLTTLTGLLGPARSVVALASTLLPIRTVDCQPVTVEEPDNWMLLLEHGDGVLSSVASSFGYGPTDDGATLEIIGSEGSLELLGWDWEPHGVVLRTSANPAGETLCADQQGYHWCQGAGQAAAELAGGPPLPITPAHVLHVLDTLAAARQAAATGACVAISSAFDRCRPQS